MCFACLNSVRRAVQVISRSAVAMAVYQEIMRLEGAAPVLFRDAKQDTVICLLYTSDAADE